jgi:hypothetical protein
LIIARFERTYYNGIIVDSYWVIHLYDEFEVHKVNACFFGHRAVFVTDGYLQLPTFGGIPRQWER